MKSEALRNSIVTTDLHLSEAKHADYRWKIFSELMSLAEKVTADWLYILGDLTDAKDHHSAEFVNDVWKRVRVLAKSMNVVILKGNHDYRTGPAFFKWLDDIPGVTYVDVPGELRGGMLCLPHTRTPKIDWKSWDFSKYDCVLMHETANGSIVSNGYKVPGIDPVLGVRKDCLVLSGDVHVPQKVGDIVYVGSPYHVHFGDRFKPRVLHFDSQGVASDVHLDFPERFVLTIRNANELMGNDALKTGNMLKIRIDMDLTSMDFRSIRQQVVEYCTARGVVIQGMEIVKPKHRLRRPLPGSTAMRGDDAQTQGITGRGEPAASIRAYGEDMIVNEETIEHGIKLLQEAREK